MVKKIIPFPPTLNFAPAFDDATMEAMETAAQSNARGQERRCALVVLARDRALLLGIAEKTPEVFADLERMVEAFRVHAQASLELAESACARLQIVKMAREASHV
jgi:hypothetical protein